MRAVPYAVRTLIGRDRPGRRRRAGRVLCNCFDVAESESDAFLAQSNSLPELQARLKCGTNCGSCLPELKRQVAARSRTPLAA